VAIFFHTDLFALSQEWLTLNSQIYPPNTVYIHPSSASLFTGSLLLLKSKEYTFVGNQHILTSTTISITIGPVAVMSLLTGHIITAVQAKHKTLTGPEIANALALLAGSFVFVLGVLRLGFIVDFIPLPAIAAFMTGSALNIAIGQLAGLLGMYLFIFHSCVFKLNRSM
jgi:hypothetical protein